MVCWCGVGVGLGCGLRNAGTTVGHCGQMSSMEPGRVIDHHALSLCGGEMKGDAPKKCQFDASSCDVNTETGEGVLENGPLACVWFT